MDGMSMSKHFRLNYYLVYFISKYFLNNNSLLGYKLVLIKVFIDCYRQHTTRNTQIKGVYMTLANLQVIIYLYHIQLIR